MKPLFQALLTRAIGIASVAGTLWLSSLAAAADAGAEVARPADAPAPTASRLCDPLKPLNLAFFHFNDKLYFWLFKPLAQGYGYAVPRPGRVWVRNFFTNLGTPVRSLNCALQLDGHGAGTELGRFGINSTVGVLGFTDPALNCWQIKPRREDFGQTLGHYGVKPWIYLHWPIFGPSNPRDTVGLVADSFADPLSYLLDFPVRIGMRLGDRVNTTSLTIGQYERMKAATQDPYAELRDSYGERRAAAVRSRD